MATDNQNDQGPRLDESNTPTAGANKAPESSTAAQLTKPQKRGPGRLIFGYFGIATLFILGGSAWIYFFGLDFWPILPVAIGSFMVAVAIARWQRSLPIGLGALVVATGIIGFSYYWFIGRGPYETKIIIRVAAPDGNPVPRAGVLLLYGGETPIKQVTDSSGLVQFTANSMLDDARLVVEANEFQVHEQTISLDRDRDFSINLRPLDENIRTILVRVVNKADLRPIERAEVVLITQAKPFSEFTDINGLARFSIEFRSSSIDADLTVEVNGNTISNQNTVLYPDQLQDVRLDAVIQELNIVRAQAITNPTVGGNEISMFLPDPIARNVEVFLDAPTTSEQEPNDEKTTAQILTAIGSNHPIAAEINAYKDIDHFAFDAVAGQTYVAELYAVDSNLGLATSRYNCYGWVETFKGLRLTVYDPGDNPVAWQCAQNAGGNNYATARIKAAVSGRYVIEVVAQSETVLGSYRLRVAPKYDEPGAAWIEDSLEPNNDAMNAFPIEPGLANTITSAIESRNSGYLSDQADVDWYVFNAQPGRTYVVELLNVEDLLGLGSNRYNCYGWIETFNGLGLAILNPNLDLIQPSCLPNGAGDVHNIVEFKAQVGGPHYIQVFPQVASVAGVYSIRVLPKHNEPGAAQDAVLLEPNNRQPNASQMSVEDRSTLISVIEERTPGYSTNTGDVDWYVFTAKAGTTYVIELIDVGDTLKLGSNRYNCYGGIDTFSGVGLAIFNAAAELQAVQCYPNGEGNVHTSVEFQALLNNDYYIQAFPHFAQAYGEYTIRIRKK